MFGIKIAITRIKKEKKVSKKQLEEAISNLFNYSFTPISWEYKNLTTLEKLAISEKEFEALKKRYKKQGLSYE